MKTSWTLRHPAPTSYCPCPLCSDGQEWREAIQAQGSQGSGLAGLGRLSYWLSQWRKLKEATDTSADAHSSVSVESEGVIHSCWPAGCGWARKRAERRCGAAPASCWEPRHLESDGRTDWRKSEFFCHRCFRNDAWDFPQKPLCLTLWRWLSTLAGCWAPGGHRATGFLSSHLRGHPTSGSQPEKNFRPHCNGSAQTLMASRLVAPGLSCL